MNEKKRWIGSLFIGLTLVVSLAINGLQGIRILKLEDELGAKGSLAEGAKVPDLRGKDPTGVDKHFVFRSSELPTLLYVFQPSCVWCQRNASSINSLVAQSAGKFQVVGLSLSSEGLTEFIERHQMTFPVFTDLPVNVAEAYHLGMTPETIIVSPDGTVLKSWGGAYSGAAGPSIEKFFSLRIIPQS
jgi:peroxiredoxin